MSELTPEQERTLNEGVAKLAEQLAQVIALLEKIEKNQRDLYSQAARRTFGMP